MSMRLLVVGGCGSVGSMVLPGLARRHEIRVLDVREPSEPVGGVEYHTGDARDVDLVTALADGIDSLLYLAMGPAKGAGWWERAERHLDTAVTSLYLALTAAHHAGARHAIYTSSQSVYRYVRENGALAGSGELGRYPEETVAPDARDFYGLAKRLGEEVCRTVAAEWSSDVVCLRLCFPTPDDQWPRRTPLLQALSGTSARDTCAALEAALAYRGRGFDTFGISGDAAGRVMSLSRARDVLGWQPQDRNELPDVCDGRTEWRR